MNKDHFQAIMQNWLQLELEKIPELKPSETLYELLQKNARKERSNYTRTSWYMAAAALLLLVFFTVANYEKIFYPAPPAVAELETRQGVEDKDEISFESTFKAHRKLGAPKGLKEEGISDEVMFHFQREGTSFATEVDMDQPLEYPVGLSQSDNYRISVQPASVSYLYVFQLNSEGELIKLFPEEEKDMNNPLTGSVKYMLPDKDSWYHLDEQTGEEKIYLCMRQEASDELLTMYDKYRNTRSTTGREKRRDQLLQQLEELNSRTMLLENQ
jgi:hypothetical protein